jgi:thioester reductase-like protein
VKSIIAYLERWTEIQPNRRFICFLDANGRETETYTYLEFNGRSRHLAEHLSRVVGLKRGDRALLIYPPGLEVIVAFYACARIGVIPVPVYPPTPSNFERGMAKLAYVARDCGARFALTTRGLYGSCRQIQVRRRYSSASRSSLELTDFDWVTTDDVRGQASVGFHDDVGPILFLQYTSGSTSDPKGVIVTHENVIQNGHATVDHQPTGVSWLPQYHDMGLIGYYLFLVITGGTTFGFSPLDFLKRPILWLQTLSRVRATYSSSPNFGFEYCLREDKVSTSQLTDVDLSALRVLMNAAEPVRPETFERFLERFGPYGLRSDAHVVAYGLAENTLAATHYGARMVTADRRILQEGALRIDNASIPNTGDLRIASCGRPLPGIQLQIVEPRSRAVLDDRQIGEIWLAGKSVCEGYWNRPELTHEVFRNQLADDPSDDRSYLRTGDLGFVDNGELFVCGRIKDLIIIRGVNYFPHDLEAIVESASTKIRKGGVAAFSGNEDGESMVVVAEVHHTNDLPDPTDIVRVIRGHYNIGPHTIALVPPRSISKTTSGKVARGLTRQRWLNGELLAIATYVDVEATARNRNSQVGLAERVRSTLASYDLKGDEEHTLGEIGVDSLSLVTLVTDLAQLLEERGATDLAQDVDAQLLQRLTVAQLFTLVANVETILAESVDGLRRALKQLRAEYAEQEQQRMRDDIRVRFVDHTDTAGNDQSLTTVLLTGPTGHLGPFLLDSLLRQTPYTYYALTRAADSASGLERIRDCLRRSHLWTGALDRELARRVQVICGDLAEPNLGLPPAQWESLATRVQGVIHSAALVNYVQNYAALRSSNVGGTQELLRFSFTGTKKEFHFVSSTIIFGWTSQSELLEADNNDSMRNLDFGYAQSKWVAEQLVFAAEQQGLQVRVYRPSFLSASAAGIASKDDISVRLLAFMINHGVAVNSRNQISLLPVDVAADHIAAIIGNRRQTHRTLHVTVDDYYNLSDITRLITREHGYQFVYYDIPDFVAELNRRCRKDDSLYPLLDFFNRSQLKLAAMQRKRYNNNWYREARKQSGLSRADPSLKDVVSYLITHMVNEGIIPETAEASALQRPGLVLNSTESPWAGAVRDLQP